MHHHVRAVYISPDGISYPHSGMIRNDVTLSSHSNQNDAAISSNSDPGFRSFQEESNVIHESTMGMRVMSTEEHQKLPAGTLGTIVSFDDITVKGDYRTYKTEY